MDTTQTQPTSTDSVDTSAPATSSQLDPQAVQLSQSIRQVESGGVYDAKGASGEYGAYQFEPATWEADAPAAGVNVPLQDATSEQQNQVAYTKIKQLKDQGYNVGQIASIWNAGNPTAYLDQTPGTNAEGVQYNTPAYAQKVASTYQAIKSGQPITQETSGTPNVPEDTSGLSTGEKLLFGLGAAGLTAGAIALGQPEALPEAASLGADAAGAGFESAAAQGANVGGTTSGLGGILNTIKSGLNSTVSKIAGGVGLGDVLGNVAGNLTSNKAATAATNAGNEEANATEQAGQAEANATTQAGQEQVQEEQLTDDDNEAETENAQTNAAMQNTQQASQAFNTALNQSQGGRIFSQTPEGQQGVNALATMGVNPNIENGNFATQDNQKELSAIAADLDEKEQDLHTASGDTGDLNTVAQEAKEMVRQDKRIPSTDWEAADKVIDERIKGYGSRMGESPTLGRGGIGQIRRDGYKAYDKNASNATNAAGRALGNAANKHMLDKSSSKELIGGLHKKKQDLIHARTVLKHLDGKKAPEKHGKLQKLLHGTGKYASLYIGDKLGGPIGAVIGDMVGKNIIKSVDKRYGKNLFEKPATRKALEQLKSKSPDIYAKVEKQLKKYGVQAEAKKASDITKSHQAWQGEQMAKKKDEKRTAYQEKKKGILGVKTKKSEYEPYEKPSVIKMGKTPIPKNKQSVKGLPIIR